MIQLHYDSGTPYWINPDHIERIELAVGDERAESIVYMVNGNRFRCGESSDEIVALINPPPPPPDNRWAGVPGGMIGGIAGAGGDGAAGGSWASGVIGYGGAPLGQMPPNKDENRDQL